MKRQDRAKRPRKKSLPRKLASSRVFWDYFMGPGYNRRVLRIGREFYRPFVNMVVEGSGISTPERILDIGSGPGLVTLLMAEEYPLTQVIGVDFSRQQVRAASRLLSREHIDNCSFMLGNAVGLPFDSGSFDMVVSTFSISCWPDICKGLKEVYRVLAGGGEAFILDADCGASEEEVRRFVQGYAAGGAYRHLHAWFTARYVFGRAIAIDHHAAGELAGEAGFEFVEAEKKPGLPFFRLILRK